MQFFRILLLHFEGIFEHRFRSLIWFLIPVVNMLPIILFWTVISKTGQNIGWSMKSLNSYYLMLIIAISMLTSHIEEEVAEEDIKQGELSRYLIKPFSYYWIKFFEEAPYRVLQGLYGVALFLLFSLVFSNFFQTNLNSSLIFFGLVSSLLAFLISFTFKMILGYTAFWMTDSRSVAEAVYILTIILGGQVVPLDLFPNQLKEIVTLLPFASMIYFPIVIFLGKVTVSGIARIISLQIFWLLFFTVLERSVWKKGKKEFTAIGR